MQALRPVLFIALLGLFAATAHAGGVALRWDRCYGDGGTINRNFACNTNSGTSALVCSFVLDQDMPYPNEVQLGLGVAAAAAQIPAWWSFKDPGSCRPSSLVAQFNLPDVETNCPDWGNGQVAGGVGTYELGTWGPNSARIDLLTATPCCLIADLFAQQEYFAVRLRIDNARTVGTGACAGCEVPTCIALQSLKLSLVGRPEVTRVLTSPLNGTDSHYATWQGGGTPTTSNGTGCPAATPTRRGTWATVKSLYR